jgi:Rod binding domain-containing protein
MELPPMTARAALPAPAAPDAKARAAAEAFEAAFLAEVLKHSGLNALPASFGGGAGEEAFASFLTREYARLMSERGGIGLAEQVFEALKQGTPTR